LSDGLLIWVSVSLSGIETFSYRIALASVLWELRLCAPLGFKHADTNIPLSWIELSYYVIATD